MDGERTSLASATSGRDLQLSSSFDFLLVEGTSDAAAQDERECEDVASGGGNRGVSNPSAVLACEAAASEGVAVEKRFEVVVLKPKGDR